MSTAKEILQKVQEGGLSIEDATKQISDLNIMKKVTYRVSQKGAVSFYGIRCRPITLYKDELETICDLANTDEFKYFLESNKDSLSTKKT